MKAIQIDEFGGPEVMELRRAARPRARATARSWSTSRAAAINFADTHATRNDYLAEQQLPLIPGGEVAGRTADGRRVAALLGPAATRRRSRCPRRGSSRCPTTVSDDQAAALLLQGLTAHALVHRCARAASPARRWSSRRRRGGTGTPRGAARQARRRARDRARLAARRSGSWSSGWAPTRPWTPAPRTSSRRSSRPTAATRSTPSPDDRRRRLRGVAADAGAVRAHGHLRHRLARAERGRGPAI